VKAEVIATLERRKESMIAALWANDGLNDDKGTRASLITEVEEQYDEAVNQITTGIFQQDTEESIDKESPFFAAMERGKTKLEQRLPIEDQATVEQVVNQEQDFSRYIDQS